MRQKQNQQQDQLENEELFWHYAYPSLERKFPYDVIVVTSPNRLAAKAAHSDPLKSLAVSLSSNSTSKSINESHKEEVETDGTYTDFKQNYSNYKFECDEVIIISTHDPFNTKMGSGGGTIAALHQADSKWKERQNEKASTTPNHHNERSSYSNHDFQLRPSVLIIHAGGDASRCPTQMALGKAWTSLPVSSHEKFSSTSSRSTTTTTNTQNIYPPTLSSENIIINPTVMLVDTLSNIFMNLPKGSVTVAASDVLISIPYNVRCEFTSYYDSKKKENIKNNTVIGLAVPAPLQVATNHGVFFVNNEHDNINNQKIKGKINKSTKEIHEMESSKTIKNNSTGIILPVSEFFQKPTVSLMKERKKLSSASLLSSFSTNNEDRALIDTGVVTFLPQASKTLRELATFPHGPMIRCTRNGLQKLYFKQKEEQNQKKELTRVKIFHSESLEDFAKQNALKIELYSHIMLALSTIATSSTIHSRNTNDQTLKEIYFKQHLKETQKIAANSTIHQDPRQPNKQILSGLFDRLHDLSFHVLIVDNGQFCHLGTTKEMMDMLTFGNCYSYDGYHNVNNDNGVDANNNKIRCQKFGQQCQLVSRAHSYVGSNIHAQKSSIILNSFILTKNLYVVEEERYENNSNEKKQNVIIEQNSSIGSNSVIEHCSIQLSSKHTVTIGDNCLLSGVRGTFTKKLIISDGLCIHMLPLMNYSKNESARKVVCIILHIDDNIKKCHSILGINLKRFMNVTGLQQDNLWPNDIKSTDRILWNGNFHPIFTSNVKEDLNTTNNDCSIDLSLIFSWITELIQNPELNDERSLSLDAKTSISKWKELPRISLQTIRSSSDALSEFNYRQKLTSTISKMKSDSIKKMETILSNRLNVACNVHPFIDSALGGNERDLEELCKTLDKVALSSLSKGEYDITSRCFMVISLLIQDLMSMLNIPMSTDSVISNLKMNNKNLDFTIDSLRKGDKIDAARKLCFIRHFAFSELFKWCRLPLNEKHTFPAALAKCASLFEKVANILTEFCVGPMNISKLASRHLSITFGKWVIASAPARVDLSGGWSDTPPISYEHGGAVVCMAVKVDNRRPLSARCRKINGGIGGIRLVTEFRSNVDGRLIEKSEIHVRFVEDLLDFHNPKSTAALLKAALICLGLIPQALLNNYEESLSTIEKTPIQQLLYSFLGLQEEEEEQVGLEIISTSLLPRGSGMGGSSILGGCILACIGQLIGYNVIADGTVRNTISNTVSNIFSLDDSSNKIILTHAVLVLEQLMTTGGGWQDQIGGLVGGLKIARSKANTFPLEIDVENISLDLELRNKMGNRLVLIFTGKPRLAKDILQNVLRSWARRTRGIVDTVAGLVKGAEQVVEFANKSDVDSIGKLMTDYWELKKTMSGENSETEPPCVHSLLSFLIRRGYVVGGTLCGAGGGGFLVLLVRDGMQGRDLQQIVEKEANILLKSDMEQFTWHECTICEKGLSVEIVDGTKSDDQFNIGWHA